VKAGGKQSTVLLIFNGLHGVISQKIVFFITDMAANQRDKTSNPIIRRNNLDMMS
jgi:hypothetical protein